MNFIQTSDRSRRLLWLSLGAIVLSAGCFGGSSEELGYHEYRARKTAFLELVEEFGGTAKEERFSMAGREGTAWKIDVSGAQFSPEQGMEFIQLLKPAGYIAAINFSGSSLTDEHLIQFDEDASGFVVMDFDLGNTAITDASIDKLDHFMALQNVNLSGTKVTKAAVDRWMDRRKQNPNIPSMFLNPKITM